jgi:hypothetical protein
MNATIAVENDKTYVYAVTLAFPETFVANCNSSFAPCVHLLQKKIQNKN